MVLLQHCSIRPFPQVGLVSCLLISITTALRPANGTRVRRYNQFPILFSRNDSGETATCLFNSPHEDAVLPRVLPGKLLSLDAQCRMDRGTSACFVSTIAAFTINKCSTLIYAFFSVPITERRSCLRSAVLFRRFVWLLRLIQTGSRRLFLR